MRPSNSVESSGLRDTLWDRGPQCCAVRRDCEKRNVRREMQYVSVRECGSVHPGASAHAHC